MPFTARFKRVDRRSRPNICAPNMSRINEGVNMATVAMIAPMFSLRICE